jgi:Tol biopolymer transport system component
MRKKILLGSITLGALLVLGLIGLGVTLWRNADSPPHFVYAFASDRSGAGDIFVLDASGQLCNITNHPDADWSPAWSPDGRMLAFTSHRSGNSDIWLQDITQMVVAAGQPTPEHAPPPRNLTNNPAWDYSPSWSPGGQSITFVSERDGDPEIFVQNLAESSAIQLTFNNEIDHLPSWSPDGKYIAFAAVREGVQDIYRIRPDGTDEQLITPHAVQGTAPAWSPDSQRLAFVGWDDTNRAGIYIVGPKLEDLALAYQSQSWLGSVSWSADGKWLTFTAWESGNHEVYALPVEGGAPVRMSINEAWDDFLVINPATPFSVKSSSPVVQAAPAVIPTVTTQFIRGVNIADLSTAYLVNDLGFSWAKGYVNWETVEPEEGQFRWVDPDNVVKAFGDRELNILLRVHGTPAWARPTGSPLSYPPANLDHFETFITALAQRYQGRVAAYEIWNEPNLNYEWGNLPPDPARYTEMLKTAYTAIKKVEPQARVITGGLATTGNGSATAYGDLAYLQAMYDAGAKGYFDALGSHPYGFGQSPDQSHPDGLSFDRVTAQHQVMAANNDADTPIWITEAGWVLQSSWDLGEHAPVGVTEAQQAAYLSRAYTKTQTEWPFVQAMFLFNLDFSTAPWYSAPEPMRWYAILNPDRTPRPAYTELRQLRPQ